MLVETYIEALLINEAAADAVWEAWNEERIDDELATALWRSVVAIAHEPQC